MKNPDLIAQSMQAIHKKQSRVFQINFLLLPLLAFALGFAFIDIRPCLAFVVASFLYRFFYIRRVNREYADLTNQLLLTTGFAEAGCEQVEHQQKGSLTLEELEIPRMVPIDKIVQTPLQRETVCFTLNDTKVHCFDYSGVYRIKQAGSNRASSILGIWVSIDLGQESGADWRLMDQHAFEEEPRRQYFNKLEDQEKANLNIDWFDEKFYFYRPVGSDQRPSEKVLAQLKALQEFTPGQVCLALRGDHLYAFIAHRFLGRNVTPFSHFTEQHLQLNPLPELDHLMRIAHLLKQ